MGLQQISQFSKYEFLRLISTFFPSHSKYEPIKWYENMEIYGYKEFYNDNQTYNILVVKPKTV